MKIEKDYSSLRRSKPHCLGTGFVALDVVGGEYGSFAATGGSCGNVLAILAYAGWRTSPIARFGNDPAGMFIANEFSWLGADTRYLESTSKVQTPVVIQKYIGSSTVKTHKFSFRCPGCGVRLPRYRPVTLELAENVVKTGSPPSVFYFDRVSPAALRLAKWSRDSGGIVVFEPSSIGRSDVFVKAIRLSHIVKFASDRITSIENLLEGNFPDVIITTNGSSGLLVRWKAEYWELGAFFNRNFVDASGAGDWCTAGILIKIGINGSKVLKFLTAEKLTEAIRYGQALASINCAFEGARGLMDAYKPCQLEKVTSEVYNNRFDLTTSVAPIRKYGLPKFCLYC